MPIQLSVVLDSGAFLTDEAATGYTYSEVGYFIPHLNVYGDGEFLRDIDAYKMGTGAKVVNVRHLDSTGKEKADGVSLSNSLVTNVLRMHKLHNRAIHVDRSKFDCIFHFNSGRFCCSHVKARVFKEVHGVLHTPTGKTKNVGPIAHDIVVHFELADGESFRMTYDDDVIWSSENHPDVKRRFDIEVIAQHATAEYYYREMLNLGRQNYWLPNQGDAPPPWGHGG